MSLPADKKLLVLSFGDCSGGVNYNDPAVSLQPDQIQDCLNVQLFKRGWGRWPGAINVTAKGAIGNYLRGMYNYSEISDVEHLLAVFSQKLYEVNTTTGALTQIYSLPGGGEAWFDEHYGRCFVTNGTTMCKVEGTTVYPIGIDPPTSGTAVIATGGSLPDGDYIVYSGYARKVSGLNVLYSTGYNLGTVTAGAGNNKVTIGIPDTPDTQVNNKVVWMTNADGSTLYFYGETNNNYSTTITIEDDSQYNNAILYDTFAADNNVPIAFECLLVFDNRLWGYKDNRLYYSQKGTTGYDLEKFPALNYIDYPYKITGIFAMGETLYINTLAHGIIAQPLANIEARYIHTEQRYSFKYMRTVCDWNGMKIGLTNDGLMAFDGERFIEFDFSNNIRPAIARLYAEIDPNYPPCAYIYRRANRTEYALSYRDTSVGSANNNRTLVLNLSQTVYSDSVNYKTPWEVLGRGFNYVVVDSNNTAFFGQSFDGSSTIYKENPVVTTEKGIYNSVGTYLDNATNMLAVVKTRTVIKDMFTKHIIENIRALFQISGAATIQIVIADDPAKNVTQETPVYVYSDTVWDSFTWDVDTWSAEGQQQYEVKGEQGTLGYSWFLNFYQENNDITMRVTQFDVLVTMETGRGI